MTLLAAESRYKELATLRGLLFRLHYWGGRHAVRGRLAAVACPFVVPVMWLERPTLGNPFSLPS